MCVNRVHDLLQGVYDGGFLKDAEHHLAKVFAEIVSVVDACGVEASREMSVKKCEIILPSYANEQKPSYRIE